MASVYSEAFPASPRVASAARVASPHPCESTKRPTSCYPLPATPSCPLDLCFPWSPRYDGLHLQFAQCPTTEGVPAAACSW